MAIWSAEIKELEKLYVSFKGQLPDIEKELEQLIHTTDVNVVMLYSRRCMEVIITDLCECELKRPRKTEPLKGIIDKLNKEDKVPYHIITSMDHLNGLATFGTHPKDFDPEQVKPVLINLDIIIKWYLKYKDSQIIGKQKLEDEKNEMKFSPNTQRDIKERDLVNGNTQFHSKRNQFWYILKEHKIIRFTAIYTVCALFVIQAIDIIFPRLGLPGWSITFILFLLILELVLFTIFFIFKK